MFCDHEKRKKKTLIDQQVQQQITGSADAVGNIFKNNTFICVCFQKLPLQWNSRIKKFHR